MCAANAIGGMFAPFLPNDLHDPLRLCVEPGPKLDADSSVSALLPNSISQTAKIGGRAARNDGRCAISWGIAVRRPVSRDQSVTEPRNVMGLEETHRMIGP